MAEQNGNGSGELTPEKIRKDQAGAIDVVLDELEEFTLGGFADNYRQMIEELGDQDRVIAGLKEELAGAKDKILAEMDDSPASAFVLRAFEKASDTNSVYHSATLESEVSVPIELSLHLAEAFGQKFMDTHDENQRNLALAHYGAAFDKAFKDSYAKKASSSINVAVVAYNRLRLEIFNFELLGTGFNNIEDDVHFAEGFAVKARDEDEDDSQMENAEVLIDQLVDLMDKHKLDLDEYGRLYIVDSKGPYAKLDYPPIPIVIGHGRSLDEIAERLMRIDYLATGRDGRKFARFRRRPAAPAPAAAVVEAEVDSLAAVETEVDELLASAEANGNGNGHARLSHAELGAALNSAEIALEQTVSLPPELARPANNHEPVGGWDV